MCTRPPVVRLLVAVLISVSVATLSAPGGADEWKPVDPAHLALKASTIEKDADAEALFWEVRVDKKFDSAVLYHYLRIKVFTERGRESQSKVELPFFNGSKIRDVAGRTIKPDGTIIDLKPESILDQMLARTGKLKLQAKTFTLPGVEPGAIIEYRWIEEQKSVNFSRFEFQRDIPVQLVSYQIRPLESGYNLSFRGFNMEKRRYEQGPKGLRTVSLANVPAFRAEPHMPPENEIRSWMLVYFIDPTAPANSWYEYSKALYEGTRLVLKVNDDVRRAANEAIGDAVAPDEKLKRMFDFCRARVKNVTDDASGLSSDQLARLKENKSPADVLKRGTGNGFDIDLLFAAMATAAGFDARFARVADRSEIFFDRNLVMPYFLTAYDVAVKVGQKWSFFDPGSVHTPYGMLRWQEEGSEALIPDPIDHTFVVTPLTPPEKSLTKRIATLRLNPEGTLEGDVRIETTGHPAADLREALDQDSTEDREKTVRETIRTQMSNAEVSGVEIKNLNDASQPMVVLYKVRVPGYAQRTGKRLFLQPAYFQYGSKPLFAASERRYPIYFEYGWSEDDSVTIELPAGYELDNVEAPPSFKAEGVTEYAIELRYDEPRRALKYHRSFFFGSNGNILFPARSSSVTVGTVYPQLKLVFDLIHTRDSHTITLKQAVQEPK